ncbi:MAG: hypothetical protein IPL74_12720 [Bacteroidetes bacterium]|nr:hypothetical protein [Bacteroidota bacterium]
MARIVEGINKAFSETENVSKKAVWFLESVPDWKLPCVFISYQRADERYATRSSGIYYEQKALMFSLT